MPTLKAFTWAGYVFINVHRLLLCSLCGSPRSGTSPHVLGSYQGADSDRPRWSDADKQAYAKKKRCVSASVDVTVGVIVSEVLCVASAFTGSYMP